MVYYRVSNATISVANVENAHHSTRLLAQTTLRNTMGTRHLHEILSERMTISGTMQVSLAPQKVVGMLERGWGGFTADKSRRAVVLCRFLINIVLYSTSLSLSLSLSVAFYVTVSVSGSVLFFPKQYNCFIWMFCNLKDSTG